MGRAAQQAFIPNPVQQNAPSGGATLQGQEVSVRVSEPTPLPSPLLVRTHFLKYRPFTMSSSTIICAELLLQWHVAACAARAVRRSGCSKTCHRARVPRPLVCSLATVHRVALINI